MYIDNDNKLQRYYHHVDHPAYSYPIPKDLLWLFPPPPPTDDQQQHQQLAFYTKDNCVQGDLIFLDYALTKPLKCRYHGTQMQLAFEKSIECAECLKDIFRAIMKNQDLIPSFLSDQLPVERKTLYEQFSEYWFDDILRKR